jgi:hypothetical protein
MLKTSSNKESILIRHKILSALPKNATDDEVLFALLSIIFDMIMLRMKHV